MRRAIWAADGGGGDSPSIMVPRSFQAWSPEPQEAAPRRRVGAWSAASASLKSTAKVPGPASASIASGVTVCRATRPSPEAETPVKGAPHRRTQGRMLTWRG